MLQEVDQSRDINLDEENIAAELRDTCIVVGKKM